MTPCEVFQSHGGPADIGRPLELPPGPVSDGHVPCHHAQVHGCRCAHALHGLGDHGGLALFQNPLPNLFVRIGQGRQHLSRPLHHDGLELLASHDRAHPRPAYEMGIIVPNGGKTDLVFTGLPDGKNPCLPFAAVALLQDLCHLIDVLSPEVTGITHFHVLVLDQ